MQDISKAGPEFAGPAEIFMLLVRHNTLERREVRRFARTPTTPCVGVMHTFVRNYIHLELSVYYSGISSLRQCCAYEMKR